MIPPCISGLFLLSLLRPPLLCLSRMRVLKVGELLLLLPLIRVAWGKSVIGLHIVVVLLEVTCL